MTLIRCVFICVDFSKSTDHILMPSVQGLLVNSIALNVFKFYL